MSDYLWDKTGEPDAETERLENLLGQLRFQPTPFDLPAELPAREPRTVRAPRSVVTWPRLALAASLTLAVLAGAWLMLRQQTGTAIDNGPRQIVQQSNQTNAGEEHSSAAAPKATGASNENNAGGEGKEVETPAGAPSQGGERQREERVAAPRRPRLPDLAGDTPRRLPRAVAPHNGRTESAGAPKHRGDLATPRVEPERREETAQLRAEREAAEKVLYALRVTSEKLNYARQQVQETARGEDNH